VKTIPVTEKIGYGSGDFAFNIAVQVTALYLIYYFTDVFGLPAAAAGTVILVSKLWDAVSDPLMGSLSDRTRTTWGSKRPFLLFGALPFGVSIALLFAAPSLADSGRLIYALASYLLFCTALTVVNIPYGALTAAMTLDADERSRISAFRMAFGIAGTLIAASATKPLVGLFATEALGFRSVGIAYGVVATVIVLITFGSVRERAASTETADAGVRTMVRTVLTNRPFLVLCAATIIVMVAVNTLAAVVNYFFKYNLGAEESIAPAFAALFVTAILSIPFFTWLSARTSKRLAYTVGLSVLVLAEVLIFFFAQGGMAITILLFVLAGVGMATVFLSPWSMIPDTVEYAQWKTGIRREGVFYGVFFFCFKLGAALAGFVTGIVLDVAGYVPNASQGPEALMGIRLLLTLVPASLTIIGMLVLSRYPIDKAFHGRIVEDIQGTTA
jgi:GPH family glycoside/pentoside/hexuronide:cation symporter